MRKLKLLIIGSNFGKYHLNASIKSKKFNKIIISSPNILKKKLPEKILKYKNFKIALKNSKIDMITIATKPKVQNNVLKHLLKKKIFPKYVFLEKLRHQKFLWKLTDNNFFRSYFFCSLVILLICSV